MQTLRQITKQKYGYYIQFGQAVLCNWANLEAKFELISSHPVENCHEYLSKNWGYKEIAYVNDDGLLVFEKVPNVIEDADVVLQDVERPGVLYRLKDEFGRDVDVLALNCD